MPRAQRHPRRHLDRLVTGSRDLEINAVLALESDLPVIQPARRMHDAEGTDQVFGREARKTLGLRRLLRLWNGGHRPLHSFSVNGHADDTKAPAGAHSANSTQAGKTIPLGNVSGGRTIPPGQRYAGAA